MNRYRREHVPPPIQRPDGTLTHAVPVGYRITPAAIGWDVEIRLAYKTAEPDVYDAAWTKWPTRWALTHAGAHRAARRAIARRRRHIRRYGNAQEYSA